MCIHGAKQEHPRNRMIRGAVPRSVRTSVVTPRPALPAAPRAAWSCGSWVENLLSNVARRCEGPVLQGGPGLVLRSCTSRAALGAPGPSPRPWAGSTTCTRMGSFQPIYRGGGEGRGIAARTRATTLPQPRPLPPAPTVQPERRDEDPAVQTPTPTPQGPIADLAKLTTIRLSQHRDHLMW
jgi:hypothetical protein